MPGNLSEFLTLALCLGIPVLAGAASGFATSQSVDTWYAGLKKPSFNPPNTAFAPVWSTLYILMGVSLYMVWRSPDSPERNLALIAFAAQLALNLAWSFVFFRFRRIALALGEIVLLWAGVLAMILLFHRVNRDSALLQIPYLLWVGFAAVLNGAILALNRKKGGGGEGRGAASRIPGNIRRT